jgi:transcription elongation factor GreA
VGKALLGRRAGDRVHIRVSDALQYDMVVRSIEKGEDDGSASIRAY